MGKKSRNQRGSMLVVCLLTICFVIVPLLMMLAFVSLCSVDRARVQHVIEGASLVAANDVSRIVINDPHFGYVALSDYAPIGKATMAADGEPLPVSGINTLIGTNRQNTILANELGNDTMIALAANDHAFLQQTIENLNDALTRSLSGRAVGTDAYRDIYGAKIEPLSNVTSFIRSNLPPNMRLDSIRLINGWSTTGARTTVEVPHPISLAALKAPDIQQGKYKPFISVPVGKQQYTFAALGNAPTLINATGFRNPDKNHINTLLRLECTVTINNPCIPMAPGSDKSTTIVQCSAFSQPGASGECGAPGVMTLRFSGEPVAGMQSWSDLLMPRNFADKQVAMYCATNGDYPTDPRATLRNRPGEMQTSTSQQFAENLYCWLRNGGLRPKLGAELEMISEQFHTGPNQLLAYEFAKDGSISRRVIAKYPFQPGVTSEAQFSVTADTRLHNGLAPVIIFRNNVKNLGTIYGGKHGGQPLAGVALNWCELQDYSGDEQSAARLGKGRLGTGLTVTDPSGSNLGSAVSNLLHTFSGETQPRKSFYSGGLAVDIEVGGTGISTAYLDVQRMRKLSR